MTIPKHDAYKPTNQKTPHTKLTLMAYGCCFTFPVRSDIGRFCNEFRALDLFRKAPAPKAQAAQVGPAAAPHHPKAKAKAPKAKAKAPKAKLTSLLLLRLPLWGWGWDGVVGDRSWSKQG
jgi:hypothetical protein